MSLLGIARSTNRRHRRDSVTGEDDFLRKSCLRMLSPIVDNVYASRGGKTGIVVPVHGSRPPGGYCVCPVVVGSDGVLNNQVRFNFRRPGDLPADVLSVDFSASDSIFSLEGTASLQFLHRCRRPDRRSVVFPPCTVLGGERRRGSRICVAEDDRQAVLAAADDYELRIR